MTAAKAPQRPKEDAVRVILCEPHLEHGYAVAEAMAASEDVFEIVHADGLPELLEELSRADTDVLLADLSSLGQHVAGTLLRLVSTSPATSIVLICDDNEQELVMEGIRHGAHDYVVRNVDQTDTLVRTVRFAIGRNHGENNLHFLAHHDALTGLANRVLFSRCLDSAVVQAAETGNPFGLLFIDLDGFKPVNDRLGHDCGDQLLKIVANRLRSNVSRTDVVARMGGDEFAVLVEDLADEGCAAKVAQRLVAAVDQPIDLADREVRVSCSVGVAVGWGRSKPSALLKAADEAMYRAKWAGGGGLQVHRPPEGATALEGALERGEYELYYQPQIDRTGALYGMEALLRWNRGGEVLGPTSFIGQLEETGAIVPVGEWVIRTALERLIAWRAQGIKVPRVAVNVSPLQLQRSHLAQRIGALLSELQVSPDSLEIEITEWVMLSDDGRALRNLEGIRKIGCAIALDDFGTGYSSLSYLHRYPVDTLKVDRSFVQDIETNTRSFSIVGSILDLGRRLGIVTVAEGVETTAQASLLRREGCNVLQGFLFGRPLPGTHPPAPAPEVIQ